MKDMATGESPARSSAKSSGNRENYMLSRREFMKTSAAAGASAMILGSPALASRKPGFHIINLPVPEFGSASIRPSEGAMETLILRSPLNGDKTILLSGKVIRVRTGYKRSQIETINIRCPYGIPFFEIAVWPQKNLNSVRHIDIARRELLDEAHVVLNDHVDKLIQELSQSRYDVYALTRTRPTFLSADGAAGSTFEGRLGCVGYTVVAMIACERSR